MELGHQVLVEPEAELQLPLADDWSSTAFGNDQQMWTKDFQRLNLMQAQLQGFTQPVADVQRAFDQQLVCGAIVPPEPGIQTLGIALNGVAPRSPPLVLPSTILNATASGCYAQKILTEISAGTTTSKAVPEAPGKRRKLSARRTGVHSRNKPVTKFVCDECTKTQGHTVSFSCRKDLRRHIFHTKAHNARPVAFCSCGTSVTRKDAMRSHHASCRGTTIEAEAAQAAGLVGN